MLLVCGRSIGLGDELLFVRGHNWSSVGQFGPSRLQSPCQVLQVDVILALQCLRERRYGSCERGLCVHIQGKGTLGCR